MPTSKYNLPTAAGTDLVKDGDNVITALGGAVDALLAPSDQGLLANRPTSTGGSPSNKPGRTYFATDNGILYRDNGAGWDPVGEPPNNAIWRTLQTWDMRIQGGTAAGLYSAEAYNSGVALSGSSSLGTKQYQVSAADSAVAGKTTKYRWLFNYLTNGVAPNQAITLDLRAVTGLTGTLNNTITTLTLGAAQPGPAVTFTPSVPGLGASASTAVVIADGTYTLGITLAGTTAATSFLFLSVSLQMQHV